MSPTGPEISRRQEERRRRAGRRRRRTEEDALRALRGSLGSGRLALVGMWVILVPAMTVVRRWLFPDSWGAALFYSVLWASLFVLIWGLGERWRRRRIVHVTDVQTLERGTVTARRGFRVQVQGEQHEVTWRTDALFALDVGDTVYAAPSITPGERIVLVRERDINGLRDVIAPRGEATSVGPAPG
ncbi:hypothetical protein [Serinicoccus sp. LYQ131]|uniref:hypothetical protein n=1 Tax=Serinicoccus sp. LYQ131 TaxID=3378797 RepID=UPI0038551BAE